MVVAVRVLLIIRALEVGLHSALKEGRVVQEQGILERDDPKLNLASYQAGTNGQYKMYGGAVGGQKPGWIQAGNGGSGGALGKSEVAAPLT